jgi:hypothetical protein
MSSDAVTPGMPALGSPPLPEPFALVGPSGSDPASTTLAVASDT